MPVALSSRSALAGGCLSTRLPSPRRATAVAPVRAAVEVAAPAAASKVSPDDPLLLRALAGDTSITRPPVWMMRQAGRYMKVYQDLCKKHPTFRERSENFELAVEISLQPWRAFQPDGVILFSDILTPLTGMGIPFDILAGSGPVIHDPIRTRAQVDALRPLIGEEATPYVGQALRALRQEVGKASTVLGFVGAPFTLATYIVEGGSSKNYTHIKKLAFGDPDTLHALLSHLAGGVADYIRYQADNGAQAVQIFDSWAAELAPQDFDVFSGPYIKRIIDDVKATHPDLQIILYIANSGGIMERMAACGPDVISVDQRVDMGDARARIGPGFAVQGNMDPGVLFGSKDAIARRVVETVKSARGARHIMNLGHGVLVGTPEDAVAHFFETAKSVDFKDL